MSILTYAGRVAMAKYIQSSKVYLAIGEGDPSWGTIPDAPDYEATGLIKEIGRKLVTRAFFVKEDDNGIIDMPDGRRYSISDEPTRIIYFHFIFNFGEGIEVPIKEAGIFIGTKIKAGLPENQTFFTPDEIENPGTLLLLEHLENEDRLTPNKKGSYGTLFEL